MKKHYIIMLYSALMVACSVPGSEYLISKNNIIERYSTSENEIIVKNETNKIIIVDVDSKEVSLDYGEEHRFSDLSEVATVNIFQILNDRRIRIRSTVVETSPKGKEFYIK